MLPSLFANLLNHWISVNDWQFIGPACIDLSTCFSLQQFLIILLVPYFCCLYKLQSHVTFETCSSLHELFCFSALCHFLCSNNCTQFLLSLQTVTLPSLLLRIAEQRRGRSYMDVMQTSDSSHHGIVENSPYRIPYSRNAEGGKLGNSWYFSRKEIEENSLSRKDGIDLKKESHLRKTYCVFLQDLGMRLQV